MTKIKNAVAFQQSARSWYVIWKSNPTQKNETSKNIIDKSDNVELTWSCLSEAWSIKHVVHTYSCKNELQM